MEKSSIFLSQYMEQMKEIANTMEFPEEISNCYQVNNCIHEANEKYVFTISKNDTGERFILKCFGFKRKEFLLHEYTLLCSLTEEGCPGIPKPYGYYETSDYSFLIEQFIPGYTLYDLIEAGYSFSYEQILSIGIQLCSIISFLHSQSQPLIHRDITPKNIIWSSNGSVTLIDFETVRMYAEEKDYDTVYMGTAAFSAPEQFGYGQTDVRSDIYSIGAVLYYIATREFDVHKLSKVSLNKSFRRLLEHCLSFSPAQRYSSVADLRIALNRLTLPSIYKKTNQLHFFLHFTCLFIIAILSFFCLHNDPAKSKDVKSNTDSTESSATVTFCEPLIESAVRHYLGFNEKQPITYEDLQKITYLYICGDRIFTKKDEYDFYTEVRINEDVMTDVTGSITSLSDLTQMHALQDIVLANEKISDLSPITSLPIRRLVLPYNEITDCSIIQYLPYLSELNISYNPIIDLNPLSNYIENNKMDITELVIAGIYLKDLSFLYSMDLSYLNISQLTVLDQNYEPLLSQIHMNQIRTCGADKKMISYINQMHSLQRIELFSAEISDLTKLSGLTIAREFHLHGSKSLTSLKGIENFPYLSFLGIGETSVTDLSPLLSAESLTGIEILETPIEDNEVLSQMPNLTFVDYSENQKDWIPKQFLYN